MEIIANGNINIIVIGRTGDGKSTLCNSILEVLKHPTKPFSESSSAKSHTHEPMKCTVERPDLQDIMIMDTPGLMDSDGVEKDEMNIQLIVEAVSACESISSFILVVNEQANRFDDGMQNAVKLFVDSFGPESLNHMGIMFTKAMGPEKPPGSADSRQKRTEEITTLIKKRTGIDIRKAFPSWRCDSHPENMAVWGVPQDKIDEFIALKQRNIEDMVKWSACKKPLDTTGAVIGQIDYRKKEREHDAFKASVQAQADTQMKLLQTLIETGRLEAERLKAERQEMAAERERKLEEIEASINRARKDQEEERINLEMDRKKLEEQRELDNKRLQEKLEAIEGKIRDRERAKKAWTNVSAESAVSLSSSDECENKSDDSPPAKRLKPTTPSPSDKVKKDKQIGWTKVRNEVYPVFEGKKGGQYFLNKNGNRSYLWGSKQGEYSFAERKKDL